MDSCRDVPQYKVMKYLVLGIISSSLLSELQVMIPTVDHNGVCICLVYPTFSTSFNDKNDKQFQGVVLSEFGVLRFLWAGFAGCARARRVRNVQLVQRAGVGFFPLSLVCGGARARAAFGEGEAGWEICLSLSLSLSLYLCLRCVCACVCMYVCVCVCVIVCVCVCARASVLFLQPGCFQPPT